MSRFWKVLAIICVTGILSVFAFITYLITPSGQHFVTKRVNNYLANKIKSSFTIGNIEYQIPDYIEIKDIYLTDQSGKTLLTSKKLRVDLAIWDLAQGNVHIDKILIENTQADVYRKYPDQVFNYQFLLDAFSSTGDTSGIGTQMEISINEVQIKNLNLSYLDSYAGLHLKSKIGNGIVTFNQIDLDKNKFHLNEIKASDGYAVAKTFQTTYTLISDKVDDSTPLDIDLENIQLKDFAWRLNALDLGIENSIFFKSFETKVKKVDLKNNEVNIADVNLDNSRVQIAIKPAVPPKSTLPATKSNESTSWKIDLGILKIKNSNLIYDELMTEKLPKGIDYNHLDLKNLNFELKKLGINKEDINLSIKKLAFLDHSGFQLEKLTGDFNYTNHKFLLKNGDFKTPFSQLKPELVLNYQSIDEVTKHPENLGLELLLKNSHLAMKDVFYLYPEIANDNTFGDIRNETLQLDIKVKGKLGNLIINRFKVNGLLNSGIDLSGTFIGLPDWQKGSTELKINTIYTTNKLVSKFITDPAIFENYNIPDKMALSGVVKGNSSLLQINTKINSSLGDISFIGSISELNNSTLTNYAGQVKVVGFEPDNFLKNKQEIGPVTSTLTFTSNATFDKLSLEGNIESLVYQTYAYQNITLNASMADSLLDLKLNSKDPNAAIFSDIKIDLKGNKYPANGQIQIKNLNLAALHLSDFEDNISGNIGLNMQSMLAQELEGRFEGRNLKSGKVDMGEITGIFENNGENHIARIESPFAQIKLDGQFDYMQLPDILISEANAYFEFDTSKVIQTNRHQNFTLSSQFFAHPVWTILVPELNFEENITLNATLVNQNLNADFTFGDLSYAGYQFQDFNLNLSGDGNSLTGEASLGRFESGDIKLLNNDFNLELANNELKTRFTSYDSLKHEVKHAVTLFAQKQGDFLELRLSDMVLNTRPYSISNTPVLYSSQGFIINGLLIQSQDEQILVNANSEQFDFILSQINIHFLSELAGFQQENLQGILEGTLTAKDYLNNYKLTGAFAINNLVVDDIEAGNVNLNLDEIDSVKVTLSGNLFGKGSKLDFNGTLGLDEKILLQFETKIARIDAKLIQGFSQNQLSNSEGYLSGNLKISGFLDSPKVNGKIIFSEYKFTSAYLGIPLNIDKQNIIFNDNLLKFENFNVQDSLKQNLNLNGEINWADFNHITYNLKLKTKNFLILNTSKGLNDLYYGVANIDADLDVIGVGEAPGISGTVKMNEQSNLTFIMPSDIVTAESAGVITFVPPPKTKKELEKEEKLNDKGQKQHVTSLTSEIIIDIETAPKAQLNIIIDELSGDNLKVKGSANLTVGIYPNGEIFTLGVYEIASGSYDFSFEFLRRNFQIEPGSMLIWTGDPYQAAIQLKAIYEVNADIQSLNAFGLNVEGFGKVPIDVYLNIDGTIQNPLITFDLKASPQAESTMKALIENNDIFAGLRKNSSEMNQQVFSLLVFNKFMSAENLNISSALNTQAIARQSVSKLLTEQLNILAGDVLGSVGLNFGINSDQLSTGDGNAYRTNLNVGLKKSFLNDRVNISVGKNFELENSSGIDQNSAELLDNIEVGYNITADGRYVVKVYRNSQFQTVLEGFILETGVSFVLSANYDKIRDLFKKGQQ